MKLLLLACTAIASAAAAEPVADAWILSRASAAPLAVRPEVHSVSVMEDSVEVRSAGLSLTDLGVFATPPTPGNQPQQFTFRIPRHPQPAERHVALAPGAAGVFLNGVPVYNLFETASYNGQNLWHFDPVAAARRAQHGYSFGVLAGLIAEGLQSPLLGFALDGYPIYGPWNNGSRMRASYRLRHIDHRTSWPDGTALTPAQYGPDPGGDYPLGTFAEDYEYVAGSGDLDQFNGRFVVTPEYPDGTYAYFLSTDDAGNAAYPYLLADRYYGRVDAPACGEKLCFDLPRTLEYVHEKPVHLIVVSDDLEDFAHLHPERVLGDRWEAEYTFPRSGRYRLYVEYTAPGKATQYQVFEHCSSGTCLERRAGHGPAIQRFGDLHAGEDVELRFDLPDDVEPYLGAWAHVVILDEHQRHFIHAHPMGDVPQLPGAAHIHTATLGAAPSEIKVLASFPEPGLYKLWLQTQRKGAMVATPFVVRVGAARARPLTQTAVPPGAIRVSIGRSGFSPARIEAPAGKPVTLALLRSSEPNCASKIAIPDLGIVRDLPLGATTVIQFPAMPARELRFACGMGMFKGMLVIR